MTVSKNTETQLIMIGATFGSIGIVAVFCTNASQCVVVGITYALFMANFRLTDRFREYASTLNEHDPVKKFSRDTCTRLGVDSCLGQFWEVLVLD